LEVTVGKILEKNEKLQRVGESNEPRESKNETKDDKTSL